MAKKSPFQPSISTEKEFIRALKKIARVSGHIVEAHVNGTVIQNAQQMMKALEDYSSLITPWAIRQSEKMMAQVKKTNQRAFLEKSKTLGLELRAGVAEQNVGRIAASLMNEQVGLIKSIPIEAGKRAQELALEAFYNGTRADEIAQELLQTTDVTESRAILIGRTETARANATINQARSLSLGSPGYIWKNSGDGAVRESHKFYKGKKLDGMFFRWNEPPTLDDGMTGHAGSFPNCRCWQFSVFEE